MLKSLVASAVFAAFVHYFYKVKLDLKLAAQALGFGLLVHLLMRYVFEGYSNHGSSCPNGHVFAPDPLNAKQMVCVPVGHQTAPTDGLQPGK